MPSRPVQQERYSDEDRPGPQPADWALFFLRAAFRRKILFLAVFVAVFGASFVYFRMRKPIYRVEGKIFVQRQQVVPSSVRPAQEESPTRTAWELVHRRENLIGIIKSAELLRSPLPEVTDLPLDGAPKQKGKEREDPMDRMVKILDRLLAVNADEGTIAISIQWFDPQQAYRIVDRAMTSFIEARHVQEITAIDEVISVLRGRAVRAREELERVTEEVRKEGTADAAKEPGVRVSSLATSRGPSEELARLKTLLESKGRAIQDVEDFRRRRLAELHAQLDEKRNMYSDAHPSVIQLRQDIDSLSKESTQVEALREEEVRLRKEYEARAAREGFDATGAAARSAAAASASAAPTLRPISPRLRAASTPVEEDERVRSARTEFQQIQERVNEAQLELDAVRAAFKYRYNVIWPAEVPVEPVSPNATKILGAGFLAAIFLALLVAAAPDLRTGRIVERWQIERSLDLTILGEINRRS